MQLLFEGRQTVDAPLQQFAGALESAHDDYPLQILSVGGWTVAVSDVSGMMVRVALGGEPLRGAARHDIRAVRRTLHCWLAPTQTGQACAGRTMMHRNMRLFDQHAATARRGADRRW